MNRVSASDWTNSRDPETSVTLRVRLPWLYQSAEGSGQSIGSGKTGLAGLQGYGHCGPGRTDHFLLPHKKGQAGSVQAPSFCLVGKKGNFLGQSRSQQQGSYKGPLHPGNTPGSASRTHDHVSHRNNKHRGSAGISHPLVLWTTSPSLTVLSLQLAPTRLRLWPLRTSLLRLQVTLLARSMIQLLMARNRARKQANLFPAVQLQSLSQGTHK